MTLPSESEKYYKRQNNMYKKLWIVPVVAIGICCLLACIVFLVMGGTVGGLLDAIGNL